MAKIIAWLIVIFVVLLALRIVNMRNARRRARETSAAAAGGSSAGSSTRVSAPMVRCDRCGTYVPRDEARAVRNGYVCIGGECAAHA